MDRQTDTDILPDTQTHTQTRSMAYTAECYGNMWR